MLLTNLLNIKKRPPHTVLLITDTKTFRVDVDKTGQPIGSAEMIALKCNSPANLAECISGLALKSGPLGRKVWMLYLDLPMAFLTMPTVQLEGFDEATLVQALQFELEGMTGQSSVNMQLAYQLLNTRDEMSSFIVCQINQATLAEITAAVKKAGSHLGGLLHPAGLPLFIKTPQQTDWLRLECWSQQVVALRQVPHAEINVQLFAFNERQWRAQLDKWVAQQGVIEHSETLLSNSIEMLPETTFSRLLTSVDAVTPWLLLWAGVLLKKDLPAFSVLRYQSKLNKDLLLMASGGSAALLICIMHFSWHQYQAFKFDYQFKDLQVIETSINSMRKTLATDQTKRDKLKLTVEKLKSDSEVLPRLIQGLQDRPVKLLEAIAKGRPDNLLVEGIETNKDEINITGISLDSTSANELANYLERHLALLGWSFIAPTKKNMQLMPGGGPWEYEIKLVDMGVDGFLKKPTP